jgi:outer membrane protein insertion porin family
MLCFAAPALAQQNVYPYPASQPPQYGSGVQSFSSEPLFRPQLPTTAPAQNGLPPVYNGGPLQLPNGGQLQLPNVGSFQPPPITNELFPQNGLQTQPPIGFAQQNGIPSGAIPADLDIYLQKGETGRLMAGGTYGSDNGFVGQVIIDERDFNLFAFPRSLADLRNPRVFRGLGQSLRVEIVPGTDLERYLVSFGDPYFLNTNTSLNVSGYYFDRQFFDWDEQRAGMKVRLGQNLTNYLSVSGGLTLENVEIDNPRLLTSPQLNANLGNSNLFMFDVGLVYDTRQSPYLLDSGSYLALTYKQAFGDYSFARGEIDYRVQRLIYKRTPTTGHHTLSYRTKLGFSGSSTPVFENFLGGGFSSMRGFDFRGVGPVENGVRVGGEFQWLNSLEYQFPMTYDDMVMGVAFLDFGTIEESVEINSGNFRVAPGVGLRINVPFAGMSAPLAVDFAFPTDEAAGDDKRTISWMIGLIR